MLRRGELPSRSTRTAKEITVFTGLFEPAFPIGGQWQRTFVGMVCTPVASQTGRLSQWLLRVSPSPTAPHRCKDGPTTQVPCGAHLALP